MRDQNAQLRQEIADRQQEIGDAQSNGWLEEEARKLGFVFPGERVFVVGGGGGGGGVNAVPPVWVAPSGKPTPSATPTPNASPTPYQLTLPTPSPHH